MAQNYLHGVELAFSDSDKLETRWAPFQPLGLNFRLRAVNRPTSTQEIFNIISQREAPGARLYNATPPVLPFYSVIPTPRVPIYSLPISTAYNPGPTLPKYPPELNSCLAPGVISSPIIPPPFTLSPTSGGHTSRADSWKLKPRPARLRYGSSQSRGVLKGKAYISRNVYKSIVRFLLIYIQKNKPDIVRILREAAFSKSEIEDCFLKIRKYHELVKHQDCKITPQATIKKIVKARSPYIYVLRETLKVMLHNCSRGKLGRVLDTNRGTYKEVCTHYYNEIVKEIKQVSQAKTFIL